MMSTQPRRKSLLYCSVCGHTAPVDGDWRRQPSPDRAVEEIHCPDCDAVLTNRPLENGDDPCRRTVADAA